MDDAATERLRVLKAGRAGRARSNGTDPRYGELEEGGWWDAAVTGGPDAANLDDKVAIAAINPSSSLPPAGADGLAARVAEFERQLIAAALAESGGSQTLAAGRLGVRKTTLHEKIKRLGLRRSVLPRAEEGTAPVALDGPEFRWQGALQRGGTIEVKGVSGRVFARLAAGPGAVVVASRRGGPPGGAALTVAESPRRVVVSVVQPSPLPVSLPGGLAALRVDFRVEVPPGVGLLVRLASGDVEVLGVDGVVDVQTLSGRVMVVRRGAGGGSGVL